METDGLLGILRDKKILYAEDEEGIRRNIAEILRLFFLDVTAVEDGQAVIDEMAIAHYDALMLDISMPNLDGLEAVKIIRETFPELPIVILSAYSTQEHLWRAVEMKITRYLTKPHTRDDLIDALTHIAIELNRHSRQPIVMDAHTLYSPCRKTIRRGTQEYPLTLQESRLLEFLIRNDNCTLTFETLYDYLWGYEAPSKEALKSLVKDLRKKIGKSWIQSVYGIGYRLEWPDAIRG
jgi:DNA-binding response OmpR family regulator